MPAHDPVDALARHHARPVPTADVPSVRGLYAIHAEPDVWDDLGLGVPPDERPLYVGKSESSLADRDVTTHFGTGQTGRSTVRRSIGALLADQLELHAMPRNPAKPSHFSNYAFAPAGDQRLTDWMLTHLELAVWPAPTATVLLAAERAVLAAWQPPLNLKDVATPWRPQLSAARRRMAAAARAWTGT